MLQQLYPSKEPLTILQECGWDVGLVWMAQKTSQPLEFDHLTFQPLASHRTNQGIPATNITIYTTKIIPPF
jgi:hypothetical protein